MNSIQRACSLLLKDYLQGQSRVTGCNKLHLLPSLPGHDVYNITAPFLWQGKLLLAGRVERREDEDSHTAFFAQKDGVWVQEEALPVLKLQDPFTASAGGDLILGGVETFPHPELPGGLSWRTVFYRCFSSGKMERFAHGPDGMKDIRLLALADGKILLFTRPQGKKGGRGKIGFTILDGLDQLTPETIDRAPLLPDFFLDSEWGGVNEVHLLKNGRLGLLSHIACFDEAQNRHYYASCFCMDPHTRSCSSMKIIACRDDLPPGPAKRPDLTDVLFSGGLLRHENQTATLYCGVSDAEAWQLEIPDPFWAYENLE